MYETCQKVKFPTVQERGINREFVFFFAAVFCSWGSRRPFLMVQGPLAAEPTWSCPAASPNSPRSAPSAIPGANPGPKPSFPARMAVHASALVSHLLSQLDADAQLDPLQLGCLPAWALKSWLLPSPSSACVRVLWVWRCSSSSVLFSS